MNTPSGPLMNTSVTVGSVVFQAWTPAFWRWVAPVTVML